MEVPGLGSANNLIKLDPSRVTTPEVLPGKVTEKTPQQVPIQQPLPTPFQAPKAPVLTQNLQTFSSLLVEMGIPNTVQNNQLVQVLANYGQPINKQTMAQVTLALGPLIHTGQANIEAAVVLMINGMQINKQSLDAVRQLLNSGGLSQNLLGFSKDLQKMVDNFTNKIPEQFSQSKELTSSSVLNNMQSVKQLTGQTEVPGKKEGVAEPTVIKNKEGKVDAINPAIKNPYEEEAEGDTVDRNAKQSGEEKSRTGININKTTTGTSLVKSEIPEIKFNIINNQGLANELSTQAQKINRSIMNLLTIDILRNPTQFPMQIAMLRKSFSELEIDIKEFKEIILKNFPGILEGNEEENIFSDLLKLIFNDEEPEKLKKMKNVKHLKNSEDVQSGILKDIAKAAETINLNMLGREMLTKSMDCMCLPIPVLFNGKLFQVEVMIRREDQSNKKTEVGHVPLKIQLAVETKTMGNIGIDINNLKRDLQVSLSVENKFIQKRIQSAMYKLQDSLKLLPFDVSPVQCKINPHPNESPSILLPRKHKVMSMRRIEGLV